MGTKASKAPNPGPATTAPGAIPADNASNEHYDVVVVGAGISGIAAAYYLSTRCPTKRFVVLERRARLGGTWDLFQYPGIRTPVDGIAALHYRRGGQILIAHLPH